MSPRRRLLILAVGAMAVIAGVVSAVSLRDAPLDEGRVPVVLVHGFGSSADSMSTIAAALRSQGREVVAIDLPDRGEGDLSISARTVADAVAATNAAQVDLVGHSAGGVVVRTWLKELGGTERARRIVTLGSPHHGAELADFAAAAGPEACLDACAQLARNSTFLATLNADDETPGAAGYTSIWTEFDETVTPPESAVLAGATNIRLQDVCPDARLSHGDLVRDPLAIGVVLAVLAGDGQLQCSTMRMMGNRALSS